MTNLTPDRYRQVAITTSCEPVTAMGLRQRFVGREAYRRTRYLVVRHGQEVGVAAVTTADREPLFSPVTGIELVASPADTVAVADPAVDVGVPSQLAAAAARLAAGARCVVVEGRYGHVSFICDPSPLRVHVVEIVPPRPAKLLDQAQRVVDVAEDLPPIELVPEVFDIGELARQAPSDRYVFPCRASGIEVGAAEVAFLDERPARQDWVLVGPERSSEIHRWFYGEDARASVDVCPHHLAAEVDGPTLTKCSLLEEGITCEGDRVVVPWGASLGTVRAGLEVLARHARR